MLLFGGNPGGSDLERFSDLWRLDLQHDSHVITEVHNLIKICKYHYLLSQDKSSAACLYLRSLQHIGTDMKAQESFKKVLPVLLPVWLPVKKIAKFWNEKKLSSLLFHKPKDYQFYLNECFEKICKLLKNPPKFYNMNLLVQNSK